MQHTNVREAKVRITSLKKSCNGFKQTLVHFVWIGNILFCSGASGGSNNLQCWCSNVRYYKVRRGQSGLRVDMGVGVIKMHKYMKTNNLQCKIL